LENEVVYTGGGDVTAVLKIRSKDLEEVTKAEVEDIAHTE
jgi:prolyl-tRNA editing enzyme YbaK/EbsC (Cys-tRNA(Pro) deacylase)